MAPCVIYSIFTSSLENSVDPDQLASKKPAALDLSWFQRRIYPGLACRWVTCNQGSRLDALRFFYHNQTCAMGTQKSYGGDNYFKYIY